MRAKTDLSKFNNSWYKPASKLKIIVWFIVNSLIINNYLPIPVFLKIMVLRLFGAKIGNNVMIKPNVNIKYPWFLEIGNNAWIGEGTWIDNYVNVVIGDNSCLSQGAMLLTGNHDYKKITFDLMVASIYLDEGVWIGAKSVICGGVRCGSHAVLTVNSVATKDLQPYTVYQGNPAQAIRMRTIYENNVANDEFYS
jgi:putative colanic acid biosynthesis acetyltransferase WcaF